MNAYLFDRPLTRGIMVKQSSQFTATVEIDGQQLVAHIPTTG